MRKISDKQLISMGYSPNPPKVRLDVPNDIPSLVAGPYAHIIKLLNKDAGPKGFDPLQVRVNVNTPSEVGSFISAMTSKPRMSFDTSDSVELFRDIFPRSLDAGSFGSFFDNFIRNIPYKPKTD